MSLRSKTISIEGQEYTFLTFPATKGLAILTKLLKIVGPSIGKLVASDDDNEDPEDKGFSEAVSVLVENMYKDDVTSLIKAVLSNVTKNGQELNFDSEFAGNYGALVQLLFEVLKENYSSFFTGKGISDILGTIQGMRP